LERTIFIFFGRIQTDWRDVGIKASYQIKRKREKMGGAERKTQPFSPIPEIMLSSVLFNSFSIDMQW